MLGEVLALGAAFVWSVSIILFRRSEAVSPIGLNLFKNVVGALLLVVTMAVVGQGVVWTRSPEDWLRLVASGVLGMGLADTLIFMALRRLGPALLAIVDTVYAPVMVVLSVLFLNEHLHAAFLVGAVAVVVGVYLAGIERTGATRGLPKEGRTVGVLLGMTGIVSMGVGVIVVKPVLDRSALLEVTLIRLVAGILAQLVWIAVAPSARGAFEAFRPSKAWRTMVPAGVLGAYVSLLLWLGGFKWADPSIASVLNQMSTVFTVVLARIFLGEALSWRRVGGGLLAVGGALSILLTR